MLAPSARVGGERHHRMGPMELVRNLFSTDFMPHGQCLGWNPPVLWLNVLSDAGIALAYATIPVALVSFLRRRRDLVFPWMFGLFGCFILLCGMTHVMGIITMWTPVYRAEGAVKLLTAC